MEAVKELDDPLVRLDSMLKITRVQLNFAPDSGIVAGQILIQEAKKVDNGKYIGLGYHYVGVGHAWQGNYEIALEWYDKALNQFDNTDFNELSIVYNSIGGVYYDQNNFRQTMEYWQKSRLYALKSEDDKRLEITNNNLAVLYMAMGELKKAKPLLYDNLALGIKNNWKISKATAYINLSKLFVDSDQLDSALDCAYKSYTIFEVIKNSRGSAESLRSLSNINFIKNNPKEGYALAYKSLKKWGIIGDTYNVGNLHNFIGNQYLKDQKVDSAIFHCNQAYQKGEESASLGVLKESCECLAEAYYRNQELVKAFNFQKELIVINDSILNKEVQQDIIRKEFKYAYQLKAEKDSIDQAKKEEIQSIKHENELKNQRFLTYLGMVLAILGIAFGIYVFRNLQRKKKDHDAITMSKEIIEEKNREITDSINYAQRIQSAMLPSAKRFSTIFPHSFILYKPKDIVAGDFYWVYEKEGSIYWAVADCTGHGVPGAMMSVVCNSALNRSIKEFGCTAPDDILNQARKLIIEELSNGNSGEVNPIKDGMDIALAKLDGDQLAFSGAYNSICIIRNSEFNSDEQVKGRYMSFGEVNLLEIKGDKQPVGIGVKNDDFTLKTFQVKKGDQIFMYSDGYPDQFGHNTSGDVWGGHDYRQMGKKFKTKNLKKLLMQVSTLSEMEQKERLEQIFDRWKGDLEQIDDVCIIGVRV